LASSAIYGFWFTEAETNDRVLWHRPSAFFSVLLFCKRNLELETFHHKALPQNPEEKTVLGLFGIGLFMAIMRPLFV